MFACSLPRFQSKHIKGFAFVEFEQESEAEAAVKVHATAYKVISFLWKETQNLNFQTKSSIIFLTSDVHREA